MEHTAPFGRGCASLAPHLAPVGNEKDNVMSRIKEYLIEKEYEDDEEDEDPDEYADALGKVKERCDEVSIEYEEHEGWDDNFPELHLLMPSGREKYSLILADLDEANAILSIPFEEYGFLKDYIGFYSYKSGYIEAGIELVGPGSPRMLVNRLLRKKNKDGNDVDDPIILSLPGSDESIKIKIDKPSKHFGKLQNIIPGRRCFATITVENVKIERHRETLKLIERIANSVCFQISLIIGINLHLQREQRLTRRIRRRKKGDKKDICFPDREYDQQPMSLFWYAKGASSLPLLQFLAYYQILEFYMPSYSNKDAMNKIKNILKDPRFNIEKDSQVARIVSVSSPTSKGYGDERSQLEAVIRGCVDPSELLGMLSSNKALKEYYTNEYKSIAPQKLTINSKNLSELLSQVTKRIYEIRCRIVHTKDSPTEHDLRPLLPFSKETAFLHYDIELLEHISTLVLICSSHEFKV